MHGIVPGINLKTSKKKRRIEFHDYYCIFQKNVHYEESYYPLNSYRYFIL